jgi:hypothetical protein
MAAKHTYEESSDGKVYLFVVGTTKGGTSTLHLWLNQHPRIELASKKELHFFCKCPAPHLRSANDLGEYQALLSTSAQVAGEASPCYLFYPHTPLEISHTYPQARILASLRDPVERFWSHYLMNEIYRPTGLAPEAVLERCILQGRTNALDDLFGVGLYREQVERYISVFGENFRVLFLEEIEEDPVGTFNSIVEFLSLDPFSPRTTTRDKQYTEPRGRLGHLFLRNPTIRRAGVRVLPPKARRALRTKVLGRPSKPPMPGGLKHRLRDLYYDDCRDLADLLGRELPWKWVREGS